MSDFWTRLTLGTYRRVGRALYPFMGPFLAFRARRGKEDRARRYERYGYPSADRPVGPIVWLHAASVGESMAIIPLIERIDAMGINTVMTTGTVTSAEVVRSRLPISTYHQYVPLDMERAVRRFLDHWRPDLAIFAESEIWPMTILELAARRVPQVLVNARMSDRSYQRWSSAPKLAEALFDKISHVIAQSDLDAERFREMGARPVSVSGNLKVEAPGLPCDEEELRRMLGVIGLRPTWIAASTHPGEEEAVIAVHRAVSERIPDLLTVVVPRHPERGDEIATMAHEAGLDTVRRSTNEELTRRTAVYLGDTIGEMGLFLRLASVAFVGRSLVASGGQNPLEPAMTGAAILSGRNVHNFRDAYRNLLAAGAARLVRDEEMLAANVEFLLRNRTERQKMIVAARQTIEDMRGALDKTVGVLDSYVFPLTIKRDLEDI